MLHSSVKFRKHSKDSYICGETIFDYLICQMRSLQVISDTQKGKLLKVFSGWFCQAGSHCGIILCKLLWVTTSQGRYIYVYVKNLVNWVGIGAEDKVQWWWLLTISVPGTIRDMLSQKLSWKALKARKLSPLHSDQSINGKLMSPINRMWETLILLMIESSFGCLPLLSWGDDGVL